MSDTKECTDLIEFGKKCPMFPMRCKQGKKDDTTEQ